MPSPTASFCRSIRAAISRFEGTGTLYLLFFILQKIADGKSRKEICDYEDTSDQFIGYGKSYLTERLGRHGVGMRGTEKGRTNKRKIAILTAVFRAYETIPTAERIPCVEAASRLVADEIQSILNQRPMIISRAKLARVNDFIEAVRSAALNGNSSRTGDIWQYLIAAKLLRVGSLRLDQIEHANANDVSTGRLGDFVMPGRIIHVTLGSSATDLVKKIKAAPSVRHVVITRGDADQKWCAELKKSGAALLSIHDYFESNCLEHAAETADYLISIFEKYNEIIEHVDAPRSLLISVE